MTVSPAALKAELIRRAEALGLDGVRVTEAGAIPEAAARLADFLADGRHGDMDWMAAHAMRRSDPRALWPEVRSIIMTGLSYAPEADPLAVLAEPHRAALSVYARGKDYHDILKGRLKQLAGWLAEAGRVDVKVFVDTAPVMEKPLAAAGGLGWQGKHTNQIGRAHV